TVRPDEESRSGGLADFKWSSLRIGSGNGNRSDAKGIIVGSHDRQRERRLIKALKLTGRRRFAPASRRFLLKRGGLAQHPTTMFFPHFGGDAGLREPHDLVQP